MKKIAAALLVAGLFASMTSAQAGTISVTKSIALASTPWENALSFSKFDTGLGTLTSIIFSLSGTLKGSAKAENTGTTAADVTLGLGSLITLKRPDDTALVIASPLFNHTYHLAAFDQDQDEDPDFLGASSVATGTQTVSVTNLFTDTSGADFALFSSATPGLIHLNMKAAANSSTSGTGNLATSFKTKASGSATVTYNYVDAGVVPEPATFAIMGLGLGILGLTRRRRSIKAA